MFRKSTRKSIEERQSTLDARERERIRDEVRNFAINEGRKAFSDTLKDFEKQLFSSNSESVFRNRTSSQRRSSDSENSLGVDFGSLGTGFFRLASRLLLNNNRVRIRESAPIETDRSRSENQFYQQSRAQFDASLSTAAQKGTRNL